MKRNQPINVLTTFLFLLLVIPSSGKPPKKNTNETTSAGLDKALNHNNSLLWQISGNNLTKPSYLYGTIHIIPTQDYFLGKNVSKKIQKSEELVMEMDLNQIDVEALTKLSLLDSNKSIKDYLSDTDYTTLMTFMTDSIGMNKNMFKLFYSKLKPFYLEQLIFIKHIGQDKESYEENFKKLAENKNIPQSGLETFEEQLGFLDEIPTDVQFKSIIKTIKEYNTEIQKLDALVKDYKKQDINALTIAFEEEEDIVWKEKLLDKRNSNWIPKIKSLIQNKTCFIAVGAGHLGGETGLINLLKKQGYTVEPISIN